MRIATMKQLLALGALAATAFVTQPATAQVKLNAAGATFPNIIYQDWILTYNKAHANVQLNYQSIGSGGGINQFTQGTVDFAGSDAPMTDAQIAAAHGNVLHIPTVLGAVVVTYNLRGVTQQLKFTPDVLADIYLGKITNWADARISSLNPGANLPKSDILVVHRSDGSGTTYIWTDYLSKISPEWAQQVGKSTSVAWPVGIGGKGNEGMTYLLVHRTYDDAAKTRAMINYIWWAETAGQARAIPLGYAPLPTQLRPWIEKRLKSITVGGREAWRGPAR
jgi:phosphate transport system substrate-binding protein